MFFSLLQTLICVLLVNGGLYAMHLTGTSNSKGLGGGGNMGGGGGGVGSLILSQSHVPPSSSLTNSNKKPISNSNSAAESLPIAASSPYGNTKRLNEELADLAQLERERLMLMGLAKQTAENTGHQGRSIITGRVKMHPAEDAQDSDYSSFLMPSSRSLMFGNVVHYPPQHQYNDNPDDILEEYVEGDGGGGTFGRNPLKYEYGRVLQPEEREFENPHDLNLDEFMELKSVPDVDDVLPDSYDYAYLDELLAEDNKDKLHHHHQQQAQPHHFAQFPGFRQKPATHYSSSVSYSSPNAYQNREQTPEVLQEFFEKEQQQQEETQHNLSHLNPKYHDNMRLQHKWQLKRAQQLPRYIFGGAHGRMKEPQLAHNRLHTRFRQFRNNQPINKLTSTNSDLSATTSKLNMKFNSDNDVKKVDNAQSSALKDDDKSYIESNVKEASQDSAATSIPPLPSSPNNADKNKLIQQQQQQQQQQQRSHQEQILPHPNYKRSGLTAGSAIMPPQPPGTHSLASQLMLRTARGQRQYDVPQIECPTAMDGMERFACPTPDVQGRYRCIDDHVLCDGFIDCPEGEDEDRRSCMFYKTTKAHLDVLADALLRWARGR
ncbi:low-density lipoprotein receptor domain-containing jelly belly protein [Glossina fuscipes fuscipes]